MSVKELYENNTIKYLTQKGLMDPAVLRALEIFVDVKNLEHSGMLKSHAVREIAEKNNIGENAVWKTLRKLQGAL